MRELIGMIFLLMTVTTAWSEGVYTYQNNPFAVQPDTVKSSTAPSLSYIPCYHTAPEDLAKIIHDCYPWVTVSIDKRNAQLVVKTSKKYLDMITELAHRLDAAPAQIALEARIVELSESGLEQIGILWNITQEGIKLGHETGDIDGILKALEGKGQARILATPKITTIEDQEAFVRIGDRLPYALPVGTSATDTRWSVQYLDAGIILSIKPSVSASRNILIELHPQVINLKEWKPTPAGDFPILSSREAKTTVEVKSGESIAIAGLRNEEQKENITKVPLLGDIPLLGELFTFRSKEKVQTEIVFIVTPRIL
jgi:general secretion pathway protein D